MKQEKIDYSEIMALGFIEKPQDDTVFFNKHGFEYSFITKDLTKKIYLDWEKEKRICKMVRIDSPKTCNIMAELPILNLEHLKKVINFYIDKVDCDFTTAC